METGEHGSAASGEPSTPAPDEEHDGAAIGDETALRGENGRPRPTGRPRRNTTVFEVGLSADEVDLLTELATSAGLTKAAFVRGLIRDAARQRSSSKPVGLSAEDRALLEQVRALLDERRIARQRIAANINQLAKVANQTGVIVNYEDDDVFGWWGHKMAEDTAAMLKAVKVLARIGR